MVFIKKMERLLFTLLREFEGMVMPSMDIPHLENHSIDKSNRDIYSYNVTLLEHRHERDQLCQQADELCIYDDELTNDIDTKISVITQSISDLETNISDIRDYDRESKRFIARIRAFKTLYQGLGSVIHNLETNIFHMLFLVSQFNIVVGCVQDYCTIIDAFIDLERSLPQFVGDSLLDPYVNQIIQYEQSMMTKCIYFAYNDSVKHTGMYSHLLETYRPCILEFTHDTMQLKRVVDILSKIIHEYIYTNHRYPLIMYDAIKILLNELKNTHVYKQHGWVGHEIDGMIALVKSISREKSYLKRVHMIVAFERACVAYNIMELEKDTNDTDLICARIIQSYRYTSIRLHSSVRKLLIPPDQVESHNNDVITVDIWIARLTVILLCITVFSYVTMRRLSTKRDE